MEFITRVLQQDVTMAFGAFAFIYMSDILLGLINNVLLQGEKFEWKKLCNSLLRVLVGAFVMLALILAVILIEKTKIEVSSDVMSVVSISAFVVLFWKGYREGMVGIYEKLRGMFAIEDNTDVSQEAGKIADYMDSDESVDDYELKEGDAP